MLSASLLLSLGAGGAIAQSVNTLTANDLLNGGRSSVRAPNQAHLFPAVSRPTRPKAALPTAAIPTIVDVGDDARLNELASPPTAIFQHPDAEKLPAVSPQVNRISAQTVTSSTLAQQRNQTRQTSISDDQIREQLLIDANVNAEVASKRPRPVPASSFLTPTAYGADWGDVYIGISQVTGGRPASSNFDGSAAIGFGLGDAVKNVGVEVSTSIISLNGIGDDGIIGFKLHKVFPKADNLAIALGWANPIKWGDARERDNHFYGVATKQFNLRPSHANPLPLTASLGLGSTGLYRAPTTDTDDNSLGIFGSLGLRVIPEVSLITSWTGTSLGVAASATPFKMPLVFTVGASDITDNTIEGPRFNSSIGFSFSF